MNKIFIYLNLLIIVFLSQGLAETTPPPSNAEVQTSENSFLIPDEAPKVNTDPSRKPKGPPKRISVSFTDDELVKGGVPRPETELIYTRKDYNYKKMIKLRDNFIRKVEKGKEDFYVEK